MKGEGREERGGDGRDELVVENRVMLLLFVVSVFRGIV